VRRSSGYPLTSGALTPIDATVRILAVLFGTVTLIGSIVQIFGAAFVLTFCDENCNPDRASPVLAPVMAAAVFVAIAAVFFVVSLAFGRPDYAAVGLVVHLVAAVGLLVFWLHESHHSDGKLLASFLAFESFAVVALILCVTGQGKRSVQRRPLLNEHV
jgi:drug/metabolite transporter (DMT)-like permease